MVRRAAASRSSNGAASRSERRASPLRARLLNEGTDLARLCKYDRRTITLHSGSDDYRLAGFRPEVAGIRFEPEVELPHLVYFPIRRLDAVGVTTMRDRHHVPLRRRLLEVEFRWLAHHHPRARS